MSTTRKLEILKAPGCAACHQAEAKLKKMIERTRQQHPNLSVIEIDITEQPQVAIDYGIVRTPALAINGVLAFRAIPNESEFQAKVEAMLKASEEERNHGGIESRREHLLYVLSAATFLIFFQAYMVAPLIPRLSAVFRVSEQTIGLIVPAYLIPYGVATLVYGLLSDRLGRWRIMSTSLLVFVVLAGFTATAQSASQLIFWRLLTGMGTSGVVPLAIALIGDRFPYERRGRPLGWLFGSMAGGATFGSTVGVMLEPFVGWRMLFVGVAVAAAAVLSLLLPYRSLFVVPSVKSLPSFREVLAGYRSLLATKRGLRTYGYVLLNGIFHSGVYTWLGLYFAQRYGLGAVGIGLGLLGYGIPGFLFGPIIGRAADRWGRRWLVPAGFGIAAAAAVVLILECPLVVAALAVTMLSLGYDMTQPLLAGIVTDLDSKRRGQAMGLNVFTLFTGFGIGSFLFGEALQLGFGAALALCSGIQLAAAVAASVLFRSETLSRAESARADLGRETQ